jgi:hypothetical protein
MTVRSLDFLDLPFLPRYRQDLLSLDSARLLTRGSPLGATALFSYLNPHRNLYTALCSENGESLMGQVSLAEGETSARLVFLAPSRQVERLSLPLLDHLARQAGGWGAQHILAEIDEDSPAFQVLRQAGFAMYAWQRVWKLPRLTGQAQAKAWRVVRPQDWPAVQSLHAQIVPALMHPVEKLPGQVSGLVCYNDTSLQAYASTNTGMQGTWLQPLVLPDSPCFPGQILSLLFAGGVPDNRSVYVCVRSYQAWLAASLEELGAEAGPRQAVMVKRLAQLVQELQPVSAMEKAMARVKPAAPVQHTDTDR